MDFNVIVHKSLLRQYLVTQLDVEGDCAISGMMSRDMNAALPWLNNLFRNMNIGDATIFVRYSPSRVLNIPSEDRIT